MIPIVRGVGALAWVVVAMSLWLSLHFRFAPKDSAAPFRSPILALELVETPDKLAALIGDPGDPNREIVRGSMKVDFLFIVVYWLLFLAISGLLSQRRFAWATGVAIIAALCATLAAGADVLENVRICRVLDVSLSLSPQWMLNHIRQASLFKWAFIFITLGLQATVFLGREDRIFLIGVLYLITAGVGLMGLVYRPAIEWANIPMALGILWVAILFTFQPKAFLKGF